MAISDVVKAALIAGTAAIVGAGISGTVMWVKMSDANEIQRDALEEKINAERNRANELQSRINDASKKYTDNIDRLLVDVRKELDRREGPSQLVPAARALVAARNSFQEILDDMRVNLNSDFTAISNELSSGSQPDLRRLRQMLETLERSWPAKKSALQIAIRKVLDSLGLKPAS